MLASLLLPTGPSTPSPAEPTPDGVRVVVVDEQPLWRRAVRDLLTSQPDTSMVAEAACGETAIATVLETTPHVVLVDVATADDPGFLRALDRSSTRVLAVASGAVGVRVSASLRALASGAVSKSQSPEVLAEAVRAVARGEDRWFVTPGASEGVSGALSQREGEVLCHLAQGMSNREIAEAMAISENTVRSHLTRAYAHVGVETARQAVAWAWRTGFARCAGRET